MYLLILKIFNTFQNFGEDYRKMENLFFNSSNLLVEFGKFFLKKGEIFFTLKPMRA